VFASANGFTELLGVPCKNPRDRALCLWCGNRESPTTRVRGRRESGMTLRTSSISSSRLMYRLSRTAEIFSSLHAFFFFPFCIHLIFSMKRAEKSFWDDESPCILRRPTFLLQYPRETTDEALYIQYIVVPPASSATV
jgi:hypothetical protein